MVTISVHNIAIGIKHDLVITDDHAMAKSYFIFHKTSCELKVGRYHVILTCMNRSGVPRNFFRGGVQQIQLRTEDR